MNEQQRLYLVQARSDWMMFQLLERQSACHRLHYLQMCTEKLSKAYFWRDRRQGEFGHAVFVHFLRAISNHRETAMGVTKSGVNALRSRIEDVMNLAEAIESLAPALSADGPNPEYPWPRHLPTSAPVEHDFQVWVDFQETQGRVLKDMIGKILSNFEAWY